MVERMRTQSTVSVYILASALRSQSEQYWRAPLGADNKNLNRKWWKGMCTHLSLKPRQSVANYFDRHACHYVMAWKHHRDMRVVSHQVCQSLFKSFRHCSDSDSVWSGSSRPPCSFAWVPLAVMSILHLTHASRYLTLRCATGASDEHRLRMAATMRSRSRCLQQVYWGP